MIKDKIIPPAAQEFLEITRRLQSPFASYSKLSEGLSLIELQSNLNERINKTISPIYDLQSKLDLGMPKTVYSLHEVQQRIDSVIGSSAESPVRQMLSRIAAINPLADLSNYTSALSPIDTSALSLSFELAKTFKRFTIPSPSDFELGEEVEEEKAEQIILINHDVIPRLIKSICEDNGLIYTVDPRDFEKIVAELFLFHGYKARLTKRTRDGGFDIIVEKLLDDGIPFKAVIECKRHSKTRKVDVAIIRAFSAVAWSYKVENAILVTSSTFTKDAIEESKYMPADMSLRDNKELFKWIESYSGKISYVMMEFPEKRTDRGIILSV